jgi:tripartite-type tricarboxylate transporter receptor subunit TctC
MTKWLTLIALALLTLPLPCSASAQTYPFRAVTLIVPVSAGGPTDTIARTLAERMKDSLGQPVVVENVTGAAGNIGVGRVARAAPDGYTIGIGLTRARMFLTAQFTRFRSIS